MSKVKNAAAGTADNDDGFDFKVLGAPPPSATSRTGSSDPVKLKLEALAKRPAPATEDQAFGFFVAADEPSSTITDADEREKASKEAARKLANKIGGMFKRVAKGSNVVFAQRTGSEIVDGRGDTPVKGVTIYRMPDAASAEAAQAETAAGSEPAATV